MAKEDDISDTTAKEGADAARARHDRANPFDESSREFNKPNRKPHASGLPFVDMSKWDATRPSARQWWIEDRIPLRQPTLLSGEGAIGKSILLLQLLASTALDVPWLDMFHPAPGPVIYFGCEDEADEIHRRLAPILAHHKRRFSDLIMGGFKLLAYAGENAVLAEFNRAGRIQPTQLFGDLHRAACELRPRGIVIDTVSDVFLGDEIKRDQVRQFGSLMRRLAIDANAGVLASSHPSVAGMRSGSGLSGSTQWHNSVRARAFFKKPANDDDDDSEDETPDDGRRELAFLKNQYGPRGAVVALKWQDGLWLPMTEKARDQASVEDLFLDLLRRFAKQDRQVSPNKSPTYAPAKFAEQPEAKAAKVSSTAFAAAMERLFSMNKIKIKKEGPPSRERTWIIEA